MKVDVNKNMIFKIKWYLEKKNFSIQNSPRRNSLIQNYIHKRPFLVYLIFIK
jgi:hypothetical protein